MDWDDRPTLVIGPVRLSPRVALRWDRRQSDAALKDEAEAGLDLAKRRVGLEGSVSDYADFQVEYELDDPDPWRDVFVNASLFARSVFRYGKFKIPFGLEENTGSVNLDFAYRSMASRALTPGRDRGFMVHGEVLDQFVRYEVGQFDHDGANAATSSDDEGHGRQDAGPASVGQSPSPPARRARRLQRRCRPDAERHLAGEGISSIRGQTTMGSRFWESIWHVQGERRRNGFEAALAPRTFCGASRTHQADRGAIGPERRGHRFGAD